MTIWIFMPLQCVNTSQVLLLKGLTYWKSDSSLTMTEYNQDSPWGHFWSIFNAAGNAVPVWTHSPTHTRVALSWCRARSLYNKAIEPPQSFSGRVMVTANWHASSTMKLFFSAILLITLRAFLIDWNLSEHALHAFPSLSLSVCIVSLKIAIFLVKTHNCQRMSCVCVHNASSIVCFP